MPRDPLPEITGQQIVIVFDGMDPVTAVTEKDLTVEERFWRFHALNPHVLVNLRSLAMQQVNSGRSVLSIDDLTCVLRYIAGIKTQGEPFKFPNDFRPFYARLLADVYPELRGKFEERRMFRRVYNPPKELGIDTSWRSH